MKRKVIKQGPATLMVSLPSKWIKVNNIKKGDEIDLDLKNNQILISSEKPVSKKQDTIRIKSKKDYLDREILFRYRNGIDEIKINFDDPTIINQIKETLKFTLGFEIIEQTANYCLIKNVSETKKENYPAMFKRMFQIMLTISNSCQEFTKTKNIEHLKTAIDLRETLTKLEQYNLRIINKQNFFEIENKSKEYFFIWHIATLGKSWSSFAKNPLQNGKTLSQQDLKFQEAVVTYCRDFYNVYYSKDKNELLKMKEQLYKQRKVGEILLETSDNKLAIFYLLRILNRVYETTQYLE